MVTRPREGDERTDRASPTPDRGQVYTLEGVIAALIVLAGLLFALQATTVTPQVSGISNPQAQQQDQTLARDVLLAAEGEELRDAVLYWDTGGDGFHCSPGGIQYFPAPNTSQLEGGSGASGCPSDGSLNESWVPPTEFGGDLYQHFGTGYSYNVYVAYHDGDGNLSRQRMVYQGQPGDGVVRASTSVALTNDTRLRDPAGNPTGPTVEEASNNENFYAAYPDGTSDPDPPRVVYLEVLVWRG